MTRIAALEQHVSDLEKSLEQARKERDAARADLEGWRGERAALNLQVRNATAEWDAALAHVARLDADYLLAQQEISSASADLSAALADNAEMVERGNRLYDLAQHDEACRMLVGDDLSMCDCAMGEWQQVQRDSHPGTALLERVKRLEGGLNALRAVRTYARCLTDSDVTRVIGQDLLATLARYNIPSLLDGH